MTCPRRSCLPFRINSRYISRYILTKIAPLSILIPTFRSSHTPWTAVSYAIRLAYVVPGALSWPSVCQWHLDVLQGSRLMAKAFRGSVLLAMIWLCLLQPQSDGSCASSYRPFPCALSAIGCVQPVSGGHQLSPEDESLLWSLDS